MNPCSNLTDRETIFAIDFSSLNFDKSIPTDIVEPLTQSMPIADIEDLAIQSVEYSRFSVGPNIPRGKFVALYKVWINRSISKDIAAEVLVVLDGEQATYLYHFWL